jgi:hypothetical protein
MTIVRVAQNAEGGLTARSNPNAFRRSKGDKHLQYLQFLGAVHHKPGVAPSRWEGSHTKIKLTTCLLLVWEAHLMGSPDLRYVGKLS